ncbi:hypothetical protein [Vulcanisaeta souniana]|uniref:Uncharacterized protein n=1 Tax=Vulcanisaeta souniana JCM 11219 TaxID=1293586 RepID=A0A830E7A6_9CREN|nr:hypothetical protein [Vulcanisaeta souniana]BDR93248.1 hypothetical protein Vsou_23410 [Vulcanisaeta souniana JCM 11219]GGI78748.1 hypothetical protein GCM10007112_14480 [Vulcanisaeta souniana JCM 11219]
MNGFRLGFVGKSSTWSLLKSLVFPDYVSLRYVNDDHDCKELDLVIVERYMADLVHCQKSFLLSDASIDGVIETVIKGLGLSYLNVGIDVGNSRCGVIVLVEDIPIMHVTLGFARLMRLMRRISRQLSVNLIIGTSPGVSSLVRDLLESLSDVNVKVKVINEDMVNGKKNLFRSRYPYLTIDELDSLVYAFTGLTTTQS